MDVRFRYCRHLAALNITDSSLRMQDENIEKAEPIFRSLLQKNPEDMDASMNLAEILLSFGNYSEAIPLYEKVRAAQGDSVDLLNALGEAYFQQLDTTKAKELWELSLKHEADQPAVKQRLGLISKH